MKRILACALALALTGCASTSILLEAEHVSHPLAGWPLEPQRWAEDELNQVNMLLRYKHHGWYAVGGIGYNLYGVHGSGFRGPALTGTVRIGYEIKLRGDAP